MRRAIFLLGVACAVAAACGGSMTTVDGNKPVDSLSSTDQNQLCTDTFNYIKSSFSASDMAKMGCGFSYASSPDPATCQSSYDACVTQNTPLMTAAMGQQPNCAMFGQQLASCNTTVATYTKCLSEEISAMKSLESQFPLCTQAAAQAAELNAISQLSADCIALMSSCQFLTVGGSSSSGGNPDAGLPDGG